MATGQRNNDSGDSGRDLDELWNFVCWDCKWRGVAQDLDQDETLEEWWCCPAGLSQMSNAASSQQSTA